MATLLYRLGRWCAEHAIPVLAGWLALLVLLGVGAATLGNPLTSEVSIPGLGFEKVQKELGAKIPEAAGGFGTVVFTSEQGSFSPAQKDAVGAVITQWEQVEHVTRVVNPFETQQTLDSRAAELDAAKAKLDDGRAQLSAAGRKLAEGTAELAIGHEYIEQLERDDPGNGDLPALRAQVAAGEAELARGRAQYDDGRAQWEAGDITWNHGRTITDAMAQTRFVSTDGTRAMAQVQFDTNTHSLSDEVRSAIPRVGGQLGAAGVRADYSVEITQETSVIGPGEVLGLVVAAIVLIITLGSLIAAGLPLLAALLGVGVGLAGALTATHFFTMNSLTPALAVMLGLAVGIDYSLFVVNRHRTQLLSGMELRESIGRAVGTAGNAVVFAGSTVVIALAALVLSGIPLLAQMGLVAAATVAVAVAVAVTVSPAVLRLMGTSVASRRAWRARGWPTPGDRATRTITADDHAEEHAEEHGGWYVRLITARPWATVAFITILIALIASPVKDLRLGLPDGGTEPVSSTAHAAYVAIEESFGPGMNGPVVAVATMHEAVPADEVLATQARFAEKFISASGVRSVVPVGVSTDRSTFAYQIVPTSGPADAQTVETVHGLERVAEGASTRLGADIGFTGQTVANIQLSEQLAGALPLYLLVVVGLSLLILTLVFRSVVIPLIATGGFLLSVAAAFGVTVAVYQWGWLGSLLAVNRPGPILSFMPIILIGVLFGLAMDYQMFLVSGMAEAYAHGESARRSIVTGFVHGAKVVTAAAVIMASVFAGFVFAQLTLIRPVGLGLAVGVLVDAVLVRMTLTPAVMRILDERAWYLPGWLDRRLPDLDVEGTTLSARLAQQQVGSVPEQESAPVG